MVYHECALCEGRVLPGQPICAVCLERLAWIPRSLDAQLERFCKENGFTRQEAVEAALREFLKEGK
jgi:hypothetical protein